MQSRFFMAISRIFHRSLRKEHWDVRVRNLMVPQLHQEKKPRPEVLVSVNNESVRRLAHWSGMSAAVIKTSQAYEKFIRWVMQGKWWNVPAPNDTFEREIWSCRAALIDGLVYEGQHFKDHL